MRNEIEHKLKAILQKHSGVLEALLKSSSDVEAWEVIFRSVYNDWPVDSSEKEHPLTRRPGSTDPRWDELLHTNSAMRIVNQLLAEERAKINQQEAA